MSDRISRSFAQLSDLVPEGADVDSLRQMVEEDLPPDGDLHDLLGEGAAAGREAMPRIRPILVALAARAAGAERVDGEAMHAAEVLHRALQLHDLAFGREGGKRRWLARKLVKRSVSFLSGNHLTLRALELARHTRPEVLGEVVDTLRQFADGHELLAEMQKGRVPTTDDWLEHADGHTGALFAFCCRSGAWMARARRPEVTALGRYGRHLGRLWHAAEDVSMLEHGDGGSHLLTRALVARPILAVVIAAERDPAIGRAWAELVKHPDPDLADRLAEAVVRAGGVQAARERMVRESWSARKALRSLEDTRYRKALDKLAFGLARSGFSQDR